MISLPDSCYTFLAFVLHVESVFGVSMIIFIIVAFIYCELWVRLHLGLFERGLHGGTVG